MDFWKECFDPAAGMSPNQFEGTFCRVCMNGDCERSAADGTTWFKRVSTQEDTLLNNPLFADPRDPKFRDVVNLDFRSALKEAITLEIADRRGDWSIPSDADVAIEASRVAAGHGVSYPAERAVPEPPTPPSGTVADGIVLRVTVRGASADYEVTLNDDGEWACSCPAYKFARATRCKHIQQAEADLEAGPAPEPAPEPEPAPLPPPPSPAGFRPPPNTAPRLNIPGFPQRNIPMPSGGIMADGTAPPPVQRPVQPAADLWAIPADQTPVMKGTLVPVGGKVAMGKKP